MSTDRDHPSTLVPAEGRLLAEAYDHGSAETPEQTIRRALQLYITLDNPDEVLATQTDSDVSIDEVNELWI